MDREETAECAEHLKIVLAMPVCGQDGRSDFLCKLLIGFFCGKQGCHFFSRLQRYAIVTRVNLPIRSDVAHYFG